MDLRQPRTAPLTVPSVDGLRGLAVLFILLGHCWGELGGRIRLDEGPVINVFVSSYVGVDMLFLVSGFVLFLPVVLNGTLGSTRSYAMRRAARILPAFYAALIVSFAIGTALGVADPSLPRWLSHLTFFHTQSHPITEVGFGVNGAMWTMSTEVLFYVCLPLVAGIYLRHPVAGLLVALGASRLWAVGVEGLPQILDRAGWTWTSLPEAQLRAALSFPSYLGHFAAGMTAAWAFVTIRRRWPDGIERPAGLVALVASAASLALLYSRGLTGLTVGNTRLSHWLDTTDLVVVFGVLVVAVALAPAGLRWPFENPAVRTMGICCYGIYLIHLPLIKVAIAVLGFEEGTTNNGELFRLAALIAPVSIALGVLSYRYLEQPFRRWARSGWRGDIGSPDAVVGDPAPARTTA